MLTVRGRADCFGDYAASGSPETDGALLRSHDCCRVRCFGKIGCSAVGKIGQWLTCAITLHTRMVGSQTLAALGGFPNLIENSRSQRRLVLRQEAAVVLRNHIGRVLNSVACLLV